MQWVASSLHTTAESGASALLPLMRTPRLPLVDWTDAPADLNGLVRFTERRNLVSARVPSHFRRSLQHCAARATQFSHSCYCCYHSHLLQVSPSPTTLTQLIRALWHQEVYLQSFSFAQRLTEDSVLLECLCNCMALCQLTTKQHTFITVCYMFRWLIRQSCIKIQARKVTVLCTVAPLHSSSEKHNEYRYTNSSKKNHKIFQKICN